eukprot:3193799-Prymnesium_polylepis.1
MCARCAGRRRCEYVASLARWLRAGAACRAGRAQSGVCGVTADGEVKLISERWFAMTALFEIFVYLWLGMGTGGAGPLVES